MPKTTNHPKKQPSIQQQKINNEHEKDMAEISNKHEQEMAKIKIAATKAKNCHTEKMEALNNARAKIDNDYEIAMKAADNEAARDDYNHDEEMARTQADLEKHRNQKMLEFFDLANKYYNERLGILVPHLTDVCKTQLSNLQQERESTLQLLQKQIESKGKEINDCETEQRKVSRDLNYSEWQNLDNKIRALRQERKDIEEKQWIFINTSYEKLSQTNLQIPAPENMTKLAALPNGKNGLFYLDN